MEKMKARAFVPSVTSTSKLNLNFGGSTTSTTTSTPSKNEPFKFSAVPAKLSESKKKPERSQVLNIQVCILLILDIC